MIKYSFKLFFKMSDSQPKDKVHTKDKSYIRTSYRKGIFVYHNYTEIANNRYIEIMDHNIMKSKL